MSGTAMVGEGKGIGRRTGTDGHGAVRVGEGRTVVPVVRTGDGGAVSGAHWQACAPDSVNVFTDAAAGKGFR